MRCPEVIHELAVPTDDRDSRALQAHLAECPSCSLWAERDAQLSHLWEATRPNAPSQATWGSLWSRVSDSLEHPALTGPATIHARGASRARKLARFGLVVLAQAAAVLVTVGVMWRSVPTADPAARTALAGPAGLEASSGVQEKFFELDEGPVVLIRVESASQEVVQIASSRVESGVDDWYLFYNELESLATGPVVAMQE